MSTLVRTIIWVAAINSVVVYVAWVYRPWPLISCLVSLAVIGGALVRERSRVK